MAEISKTAPVEHPITRQSALRTALAGLTGNALEWFDFAVYGYFGCNPECTLHFTLCRSRPYCDTCGFCDMNRTRWRRPGYLTA